MKKPVMGKIEWKKGKQIVPVNCYLCPDCGGILDNLGCAGCPHDDDWTYFYQCGNCKLMFLDSQDIKTEDMTQYGWKKLTPKTNEK